MNGYRSSQGNGSLNKLFELDADIICLQETKLSEPAQLTDVPEEYSVYQHLSHVRGRNGVCIMTKYKPSNVMTQIGDDIFDRQGRFIRCDFGKSFSVVNVYMPHGGRDQRDLPYKLSIGETLIKYMSDIKCSRKMLCGDFNVAHKKADVARAKYNEKNTMFTREERALIDHLLASGLADSFRSINPEEQAYSWWPYSYEARKRNIGWRIDYIFLSSNMVSQIIDAKLSYEFEGSDHCPMVLDIAVDSQL